MSVSLESPTIQWYIERLRYCAELYRRNLYAEEDLVIRFNSYSVEDRVKDEAHAIRLAYNSEHYNRIMSGIQLYGAKMELVDATGGDIRLWPDDLKKHHPSNDPPAASR